MSDYHFETGVLRDQIVEQLANNLEQTPYVLAELAERLEPGTMQFDDFCGVAQSLDTDQTANLQKFCQALTNHFEA